MRVHIHEMFSRKRHNPFYALKGVSFHLEKGETLGVIGGNGAGKTTLLSVISGLAEPDEGSIAVNGRVAPLMELGSGFHLELTGVENVMLNSALLGLSRAETEQKFKSIVDFAGIIQAGLYQLNVHVPAIADGDAQIRVAIGASSSPMALVTVHH